MDFLCLGYVLQPFRTRVLLLLAASASPAARGCGVDGRFGGPRSFLVLGPQSIDHRRARGVPCLFSMELSMRWIDRVRWGRVESIESGGPPERTVGQPARKRLTPAGPSNPSSHFLSYPYPRTGRQATRAKGQARPTPVDRFRERVMNVRIRGGRELE